MTNTKTDKFIFIQGESTYTNEGDLVETILVAKQSWFSEKPITETYNNYGQQLFDEIERYCDADDDIKEKCEALDEFEHCDECEEAVSKVTSYDFWNGSNHNSIIIDADEYDADYSVINDDKEIEKYTNTLNKLNTNGFYLEDAGTGYKAVEIDGLRIVESIWQGDWELYTIEIK
ncbi:MAG: hypothetical protein ACR2MD_02765 [Aridibacter sp.]